MPENGRMEGEVLRRIAGANACRNVKGVMTEKRVP